jgi:hypothetical protein
VEEETVAMEAASGSTVLELLHLVAFTWAMIAISKVFKCRKPLKIMLTIEAGFVRHIDRAEGALVLQLAVSWTML